MQSREEFLDQHSRSHSHPFCKIGIRHHRYSARASNNGGRECQVEQNHPKPAMVGKLTADATTVQNIAFEFNEVRREASPVASPRSRASGRTPKTNKPDPC